MSSLTTNLGLTKYDVSDKITPVGYNDNFDTLDIEISNLKTDYVVGQGIQGIWTYRRWASGIAECWGMYTYSIDGDALMGYSNLYYAFVNFPDLPFTFKTVTSRVLTEGQQSRYPHWVTGDSISTSNVASAGRGYIYTNNKTTMGGSISIEIKGTWK